MRSSFFLAILFFSILVFSCRTNKGPGPAGRGIRVELSFLDANAVKKNKAEIQVTIINRLDTPTQVPSLFYWGIKDDPIADFVMEMEKKGSNNQFSSFEIPDNYQPIFEKIELFKLKVNASKTDTSDIAFYYSYKIPDGSYRLRVLYRASKYNNVKDIYSNWLEFSIKN
jgi:hypothetical protein